MTQIRANWHLDLGSRFDDSDPLAGDQLSIVEVGDIIDLSASPAVLQERITALVGTEGRLWESGVRCSLKQDHQDTTCSACPLRRQNEDDPLHALCEVGVGQERAMTLLRVRQEADARGALPG